MNAGENVDGDDAGGGADIDGGDGDDVDGHGDDCGHEDENGRENANDDVHGTKTMFVTTPTVRGAPSGETSEAPTEIVAC